MSQPPPQDKGKGRDIAPLLNDAEIDNIILECMSILESSSKRLNDWANDETGSVSTPDFQAIDESIKTLTDVSEKMKTLAENAKEEGKENGPKK